jgi:hypothetical protein
VEIKKGDKLKVVCRFKGTYDAVAINDFDTEKDEWASVALDQDQVIHGISSSKLWQRGDEVPCRNSHAKITRRK